jgi:hypothetical protein
MPTFTLECFQNEYLPEGGAEVNAIVTVTADGTSRGPTGSSGSAAAASSDRAEIIMIDASGSMDGPRMREARNAASAAIDCMDDGVRFAIIAGNHSAWRLYPEVAGMAMSVASANTREDARRAVNRLKAGGGTAIGRWIDLAAGLFGEGRGIHHAILLTDGKDEGESTQDLQRALDQASGRFQCDCRGVGTDWVVSELRGIAAALLGSVDIVADPSGLTDDFTSMMRNAMGKAVADVNLRLWTPQGAEIEFVKQVSPDLADLTESRIEVDEHSGDYPTGAWGDESRDYHVAIKVTAAGVGEEMLAGRVTLLVGDAPSGQSLVRAVWTEDTALSTRINRQVAHYTGQAELADAIQEGIVARRNGDVDEATAKLGRAVRLATESGNDQALQMLEQIVEIEDAATGKIAMKRKVDAAADLTIETRSTKTVRVKR